MNVCVRMFFACVCVCIIFRMCLFFRLFVKWSKFCLSVCVIVFVSACHLCVAVAECVSDSVSHARIVFSSTYTCYA
jgi:hypothetical protein